MSSSSRRQVWPWSLERQRCTGKTGLGVVSHPALARSPGAIVLYTVTVEYLQTAVIHADRHLDGHGTERCPQQELHGGVQPNQVGRGFELILNDDVRTESFAIVLR